MADKSCPIPTPEQRKFMEIRETVERRMLDAIYTSIADAAASMKSELRAAGVTIPPTSEDYFMFAAQQVLFVRLCGGDPQTLTGGDPEIGERIVRNGQHIIDHYWKAGEPSPDGTADT